MREYNITSWAVMGDPHGNLKPFKEFYKYNKTDFEQKAREQEEYFGLIVLGDFGANFFFNHRDDEYKQALQKMEMVYYVVRGNHEQRPSICMKEDMANSKCEEDTKWALHFDSNVNGWVYIEKQYPKIRYFLDQGGCYKIAGMNVCVAPGAYSVDKDYRLSKGWSWFEAEQMTENEQQHLLKICQNWIDLGWRPQILLAHTCPACCLPLIQDCFLTFIDQSTVDKSTEIYLDTLYNLIKPELTYCGHYHIERDIPQYRTTFLFHNVIPFGMTIAETQRLMMGGNK